MKKIGVSAFRCALTLLLFSLAGCGDDYTNIASPNALAIVPFRGVVEDGPIANAKISLRDQEGMYYPLYDAQEHVHYEVKTETDGTFSLGVKAGIDFSHLSVIAVGGIDRDTGMDFNGLALRSPLGLLKGDASAVVISPLTTLVAELHDQGFPFEDAENRLRVWLSLPADADLTAPPHTNLELQRHTLLLSKIALEINTAPPFNLISREVVKPDSALLTENGSCNQEILSALGLDDVARERVSRLQNLLTDPLITTPEDAFYFFKREELIRIFDVNFKEMLKLSPPFDEQQNLNYQKNIEILAEKTLLAAGAEVVPLVEPIPSRLFRYILFTYELNTPEKLTLDVSAFSATLAYEENNLQVALENDPWIALLARSSSANSIDSPLLLNELPGDDNQQRVVYFYGSDLSPHFQAEQLIGQVFDDVINDAVLLKIIEGKTNAGLVEETWTIIATQIMQPEPKANAYRTLANALIKFNRMEEARSALDLARDLYRKVIAAKGVASANSTDVDNLYATLSSYRKAGDLVNAQSLLADVATIAQALVSNAGTYASLITGIKNVADAYIAAGDLDAAAPLVDEMYKFSGQTPALAGTYKLRIYNWGECAKRYADLGKRDLVVKVFSEIAALRSVDAATATATWVYLPDLVESLYRVGAIDEALELANAIPSDSIYLSKAFKLVATYEALQGKWETVWSIVDNPTYFPKVEDKIELLTYFTAKRPYIAQVLINAGRFDEALQALNKAEDLLDGMINSNNLVMIRNGYVKVAELYALMGDNVKAAALLQKAQAQAVMINDIYTVAVLVDIALGYHNINQTSAAQELLASAQSLAGIDPTYYRVDTTPVPSNPAEAATLIYEKLIRADEKMGMKSLVHKDVQLFVTNAKEIHTAGKVDDVLAGKECDYLLRAALYLENAVYHDDALNVIAAAKESAGQIAIAAPRLKKYLSVIATYASVHEYEQALALALSLPYTAERNKAMQSLANAYIDRDDFPASTVASIDSDGDGQPDFFHPLASSAEIASSGLLLDGDSDGDGILDIRDIRPLFAD